MTDNELIDLCVTCGCELTFSLCYRPSHAVDVDMTLQKLRKSTFAIFRLPANFHWCYATASALFWFKCDTKNSSWRIFRTYPRIIINKDFRNVGLMATTLESKDSQAKFNEQVNRMSLESLKDLVFGIVKVCNAKTKEMRRTEILASSKEWN